MRNRIPRTGQAARALLTMALYGVAVLALLATSCAGSPKPSNWSDNWLSDEDTKARTDNENWCIAVDGSTVGVAWSGGQDDEWDIYYKHSTQGGDGWVPGQVKVTTVTGVPEGASVKVWDSRAHIAWQDKQNGTWQVYYSHSTDYGATWSQPQQLSQDADSAISPSLAIVENTIEVVWENYSGTESRVYNQLSTNGGLTWLAAPIPVSGYGDVAEVPVVAATAADVYVVWQDSSASGHYSIYFNKKQHDVADWGHAMPVDDSPNEFYPSVAVVGQYVHVVWTDERKGDRWTYYCRSTDYGQSFGTAVPLSVSGETMDPSVAAVDQYVHVVWQHHQTGTGCWDVYYRRSTDNGGTWADAVQLTTSKNGNDGATWASVAATAGVVHVAFTDDRNSKPGEPRSQVFYARNPKAGE